MPSFWNFFVEPRVGETAGRRPDGSLAFFRETRRRRGSGDLILIRRSRSSGPHSVADSYGDSYDDRMRDSRGYPRRRQGRQPRNQASSGIYSGGSMYSGVSEYRDPPPVRRSATTRHHATNHHRDPYRPRFVERELYDGADDVDYDDHFLDEESVRHDSPRHGRHYAPSEGTHNEMGRARNWDQGGGRSQVPSNLDGVLGSSSLDEMLSTREGTERVNAVLRQDHARRGIRGDYPEDYPRRR